MTKSKHGSCGRLLKVVKEKGHFMYKTKPKDMKLEIWNEYYKPKWLVKQTNGGMAYFRENTRNQAITTKKWLMAKWHKEGSC